MKSSFKGLSTNNKWLVMKFNVFNWSCASCGLNTHSVLLSLTWATRLLTIILKFTSLWLKHSIGAFMSTASWCPFLFSSLSHQIDHSQFHLCTKWSHSIVQNWLKMKHTHWNEIIFLIIARIIINCNFMLMHNVFVCVFVGSKIFWHIPIFHHKCDSLRSFRCSPFSVLFAHGMSCV